MLAWDRTGRLRPVALGSEEANRLLADLPEEERAGSWHIVEPDGTVRSAGAGFPPLLVRLPGGLPGARLARRFPGAAEAGYQLVSRHRSALGRALPDGLKHWADGVLDRRT